MTEQEKTIAKIFDKSVEALGIMTKSLCDAIKSTKTEKSCCKKSETEKNSKKDLL